MAQSPALTDYTVLYAFGDSLSDAGNVSILTSLAQAPRPVSPPYYEQDYGLFSGTVFSNGPTWAQSLSVSLGLGVLEPSLAGGTNFAFGGGETGATPQNADNLGLQSLSLPAQLRTFQAAVQDPDPGALYTVSIGANDVLDILSDPALTAEQQAAGVNAAVTNEVNFVEQLVDGGATDILVLNVPDLGRTPRVTSGAAGGLDAPSPALAAQASALASQYNAMLDAQLAAVPSATIRVIDSYALIDDAVANPAVYGLTNVTAPVWSGSDGDASSGALAADTPAGQDQYLFWDSLHPSEAGHLAIAAAAEQALTGLPDLLVENTAAAQPVRAEGQPCNGPVGELQRQYVNVTPDNLNILATTPNWFIHSGAGTDAIAVSSGTNVLDGGAGSNFLTGGTGADTFFLDDRGAASAVWSTITNLKPGDAATVFGIDQTDAALSWVDGQGAAGSTGLTLHATKPGAATASLTLAGYATTDLGGRLSVSFGATSAADGASSSPYLFIQANA